MVDARAPSLASEPAATAASAVADTPPAPPPAPAVPPAEPAPIRELDPYEIEVAGELARIDAKYGPIEAAVRSKRWSDAARALEPLTRSTEGRLDVELASWALLAALARFTGNVRAARQRNDAIVAAWKDVAKARRRIAEEASGASEDEIDRRLRLAINAVGAATYAAAEEQRDAEERLHIPVYRGRRRQKEYLRFMEAEIRPWISAKRSAIETATGAYRRVVEIQPTPPPRWVCDAAERVGSMYLSFADSMTTSTVELEDVPHDLRELYRQYLDDGLGPFLTQARNAFTTCVNYADKFRIDDDHIRICRAQLAHMH